MNDKISDRTTTADKDRDSLAGLNPLQLPQDLFTKFLQKGLIEIEDGSSLKIIFWFCRMSKDEDLEIWKEIKKAFPKNIELNLLSETGCDKVILNSNGGVETWG